jgi:hypothetical protein
MNADYHGKSVKVAGRPTALLELIGDKLNSNHQKDALEHQRMSLVLPSRQAPPPTQKAGGGLLMTPTGVANYSPWRITMKPSLADRLRALTKMAKQR